MLLLASLRWPNKDPDEVLDYTVDWSRVLGSDTISTVSWFIDVDGVKEVFTGTNSYKLYCQIASAGAKTFERSILLRVRDK